MLNYKSKKNGGFGYELADELRKARRRHNLSANVQALYYELVAICNEEQWAEVFRVGNRELCSVLHISEKSLITFRDQLIEANLIAYRSGKSSKTISDYSFFKNITTVKTTVKSTVDKRPTTETITVDQVVDVVVDVGVNASDNKEKTKTKTKTKTILFSDAGAPVKKPKLSVTEFWEPITKLWFDFYKKNYELEPTFNGQQAKSLKCIIERLKKLNIQHGSPWDEQRAVVLFNHFLTKAHGDGWLKQNFLLTNLYSKLDTIIQTKHKNENGKQPTGAAVATSSIISKINGMSS